MKLLMKYAKRVKNELDELILKTLIGKPKELYEASAHLLKAGGKRLRPILLLAVAKGYGLEEFKAMPAAAAIELLHNFTLVHDDIMDRDTFRRNVPTVHSIWGEALAILAGDLLFSKAFEVLLMLEDRGINHELIVKAAKKLSWASITVAEGQALDMEFEKRFDVTEEEYFIMIEKKTAALFKIAAEIGAIIAGADDEEVYNIGEYARHMGIAFQIRDDILGIIADESKLGKPILSDIREGKRTILVIHTLSKLTNEEKKKFLSILGNRNARMEELKYAAQLIKDSGAIEYAEFKARTYVNKSIEYLNRTNIMKEVYEMLRELAEYIVLREK